jgi:hypothetical protein
MGVGRQNGYWLRLFGVHIKQAFGHTAYLVGSSLTQKRDWRDVDVRLILPDDEYAEYFGDTRNDEKESKLLVWELAWTALGKQITGLPIDFQFQQQTLANIEFKGPRSALIMLASELPLVKD